MVDLRHAGIAGENYYAREDGHNPPYGYSLPGSIAGLYAREGVLARLQQANLMLQERGIVLYVFDAYRPIACQTAIWRFFVGKFRELYPQAAGTQLETMARTYVSDPTSFDPANDQTWPVHATGGAIDLTLQDVRTGALLPMGAHFDQMDETSATTYYERQSSGNPAGTDNAFLRNRRLLYWTMIEAGFTNYPNEYWHYDLGNRFYAIAKAVSVNEISESACWYGYVPPNALPR